MIQLSFAVLLAAAACFVFRLLKGPTLADRVMAVDGLLVVGVSAIALEAMDSGRGAFLPVAVGVTLVGFVGTAAIARFIEAQGG